MNADALSRSDQFDEPTKEENKEYQLDDEVGEFKITYATDLDSDLEEIAIERWSLPDINLQCTVCIKKQGHEIIEGNELWKLQEENEVLNEVIQWVVEGKAPHMQELRKYKE